MNILVKIATLGPIGYLPKCPGTYGSIPGIFIYLLLSLLPQTLGVVLMAIFFVLAVYASHRAGLYFEKGDPSEVVIDEALGMTVALYGLDPGLLTISLSFILFRSMDIFKPPPVRQFDTMLKGGLGIVMDDVAAGVMANVIVRIVVMAIGA